MTGKGMVLSTLTTMNENSFFDLLSSIKLLLTFQFASEFILQTQNTQVATTPLDICGIWPYHCIIYDVSVK